jgi:LPXTG-motif cell wall-anchored protein
MIKRILFYSVLLFLALVASSEAAWANLDSDSAVLLLIGLVLAVLAGFARKKIKH